MTPHLEVGREVPVGLVLVGFVQVVLGQSENEVVSLGAFDPRQNTKLLQVPQCRYAAILQLVEVLLWCWDEERVHPEMEHLFLETEYEMSLGRGLQTAVTSIVSDSASPSSSSYSACGRTPP